MLKQLINDCRLTFRITADEPLLVKSGQATLDGADMAFVQTFRNGHWQVYLPGSSIKGLFRSHAERIVRTVIERGACDPFAKEGLDRACGKRFENNKSPNDQIYRYSCPICKMFGSTSYGARVGTSDCYLVGNTVRQVRDGVGIDRFTGGASHGAKFDLEVVTEAAFEGQVTIRNFELWQLALLGFIFQDIRDGFLRLGYGKSRGLGRIKGQVIRAEISYLHPKAAFMPQDELWGVGGFTGNNSYGFSEDDKIHIPGRPEFVRRGLRHSLVWEEEGIDTWWECVAPAWKDFITNYEIPPDEPGLIQAAAGRE